MSEAQVVAFESSAPGKNRSLWPVAAVILVVVFLPALIAWGLMALHP